MILRFDKENILNYNSNNNTIKIINYPTYNYYDSKITIFFNDKEIYSVNNFSTNVKIFMFKDNYVVEYRQNQSQCSNIVGILINNNGDVISIIGEEKKDNIDSEMGNNLLYLADMEFDEDTNKITIYKKSCSMCNDHVLIGFKYTYLLEDNKLLLQNKEEIYCE